MLLAGKPILELPLAFEQRMIADAVVRLGAGESASVRDPKTPTEKLDAMLGTESYGEAARRFADRHTAFTSTHQRPAILNRAAEMLCEALAVV